ncbi:hypothetical protein NFI96_015777 [Prochilodus magdalenae]|nr:hypothetical protein NFI96_015777 [Prochilodus magdalenae]
MALHSGCMGSGRLLRCFLEPSLLTLSHFISPFPLREFSRHTQREGERPPASQGQQTRETQRPEMEAFNHRLNTYIDSWMGPRDPRVRGWFLLDDYPATFVCTMLYLLIVWLGPKYMKNREPYSCRRILVVYNLGLTLLSFYMFYELEHPHTVPADGAVGVEVEGHQVFWTCNKPSISVLTTVPPHTDSLGISTKTKAGLSCVVQPSADGAALTGGLMEDTTARWMSVDVAVGSVSTIGGGEGSTVVTLPVSAIGCSLALRRRGSLSPVPDNCGDTETLLRRLKGHSSKTVHGQGGDKPLQEESLDHGEDKNQLTAESSSPPYPAVHLHTHPSEHVQICMDASSSGYNPSLQGILLGMVSGKASTKSGPPDQSFDLVTGVWQGGYNFFCQDTRSAGAADDKIIHVLWWYYFSKLIEFMDTFFFILRKNNHQITFLHVYHHATMLNIWWFVMNWVPCGHSYFGATFNSFIHVLMYSYYGLSAIPAMRPYLWWKKYITQGQLLEHPHTVPADGAVGVEVEGHQVFWTCDSKPFISVLTTVPPHTDSLGVSTKTKAGLVQFVLTMFQTACAVVWPCGFPMGWLYFQISYMVTLIILFGNFYIKDIRVWQATLLCHTFDLVWLVRYWWDRTGQDRTGQDRTGQDRIGQKKRREEKRREEKRRQDRTGQDRTGQDRTGQDQTRQNRTGQDRTGQDRTGQDKTKEDRTGQDRTGQDKTRQDMTGQDRTGQDKTRQDKTKEDRTGQDRRREEKRREEKRREEKTGQEKTGQDRTRQDKTRQKKTGQGRRREEKRREEKRREEKRREEKTGQEKTRQDKRREDKTGQDRTGQERTRQDKRRREERTRQDKTRQDKTRVLSALGSPDRPVTQIRYRCDIQEARSFTENKGPPERRCVCERTHERDGSGGGGEAPEAASRLMTSPSVCRPIPHSSSMSLEHPHTVPADGAVGVEVEGHQAFWSCDKLFISVLTTVPPHTDSLGVSTKTKAGLVTEDDPLPF